MGISKNVSKPANAAPEASKNADASFAIARVLLVPAFALAMFTAALTWLLYGTSFSMVSALFLLFFMFAVSLLLGMMISSLMGARHKEEERRGKERALKERTGDREREEQQRQQETSPREAADQYRPKGEQGERAYRSTHQDGDGTHTVLVSPKELRALPYKEYLRTPHWKRKREEKLRAAGYRCQVCNRGGRTLEVHHRTYDRCGEELDQDLTVLCRSCHTNFHKNRSLGR